MKTEESTLASSSSGSSELKLLASSYVIFRILLAISLLASQYNIDFQNLVLVPPSDKLVLLSGLYLASAILTAILYSYRLASVEATARLMLWSDILLLPMMMLHAGSFTYSAGLLLAVSFALGNSLLTRGYLVRATVASAMVIGVFLLGDIFKSSHAGSMANISLLVMAYFAIGFLASTLSQRLRTSQIVASRQQVDLRNLTEVNAFIIQQLETGAIVVNSDGKLLTGNNAAWQLLGASPADGDTQLREIAPQLDRSMRRWLRFRQANLDPADNTCTDDERGYEARFSAFGSGEDYGVLITLNDVRQLNDRAQQMKLASLGQLVAAVAHEIRNPLNAIQQSAQLLEESDELDESDRQLAQIIDKQSRRLNRLVTDILDTARNSENAPATLQPVAWLEEFLDHYRLSLDDSPINIRLEADDDLPAIRFDPDQLQQVFWNLLHNAKKHGKPSDGTLEVHLRCTTSDKHDKVVLSVCDNGQLMDQDGQNRLFEPFYSTNISGVGLGLYIAYELCCKNGARLDYARQNNNNCFRILCPAATDNS
jgi:two-component system sensor histidine kinase PilS (NtrC family)